jgi:hypothetical protein
VGGERRWRQHRALAAAIDGSARIGPFLIAAATAYVVARSISRPTGPAALLWWLGLIAIGLAVVSSTGGLAHRLRALAVLLGVGATFDARPPSRPSIAWSAPDVPALHHRLDSVAIGDAAATRHTRATRDALATALWAMQHQPGSTQIAWHTNGRARRARLVELELPGVFRVVPDAPSRQWAIAAASSAFAITLLLASVVAGGVDRAPGGTEVAQPSTSAALGTAVGPASPTPTSPTPTSPATSRSEHREAAPAVVSAPTEVLPPGAPPPASSPPSPPAVPSAPPSAVSPPSPPAADPGARSSTRAPDGVDVAATGAAPDASASPSVVVAGVGPGVVVARHAAVDAGGIASSPPPSESPVGLSPRAPAAAVRAPSALPAVQKPSPDRGRSDATPTNTEPSGAGFERTPPSPTYDDVVPHDPATDRERPSTTGLGEAAARAAAVDGYPTAGSLASSPSPAPAPRDAGGAVPPTDRESIP